MKQHKGGSVDLALMIEGQDGLNWPRWQKLATVVEEQGFAALNRSDHIVQPQPPDGDSLELWTSLTWLASHTSRIEFGPLVSPVSFRNPVNTARIAAAIDDLSGGRLRLGLGAGWNKREHYNYGFELLDLPQRMQRFQEGLEVISRLLRSDEPVTFEGTYYQLREAILLPRPQRAGGPPIVIGGNGPKYTLPLAARYAQEWNGVFITAERFSELNAQLDALLTQHGRAPDSVRRTLMTNIVFGRDAAEVERKVAERGATVAQLRERGIIVGTPGEVVDQLKRLATAGAQRVMLQWLDLDDIDGIKALAQTVLPHVAG